MQYKRKDSRLSMVEVQMRRFAVVSDIHGNKPALDAVLRDAERQGITEFLFAGDYCLSGPFPDECIGTLRSLQNKQIVRGNEECYLEALEGTDQSTWTDGQKQISYWNYRNISEENRKWLLSLPKTIALNINGRAIHISHQLNDYITGKPELFFTRSSRFAAKYGDQPVSAESIRAEIEAEIERTPELSGLLSDLPDGVYIFGHSHLQWSYKVPGREVYLLNPGSCGLPLDCIRNTIPYAVMSVEENGQVVIQLRRIPFDLGGYAEELRHTTQYTEARVWSEVIMRELRTSREHLVFFLKYAEQYANSIGDPRRPYAVETWEKAYTEWISAGASGSI